MPAYDPEKTLTENLAAFGYHVAPDSHGRRDIVAPNGQVVFTGRYEETAAWLKQHNARGERPCPDCLDGRSSAGYLCPTCHGTPFLPLPRVQSAPRRHASSDYTLVELHDVDDFLCR